MAGAAASDFEGGASVRRRRAGGSSPGRHPGEARRCRPRFICRFSHPPGNSRHRRSVIAPRHREQHRPQAHAGARPGVVSVRAVHVPAARGRGVGRMAPYMPRLHAGSVTDGAGTHRPALPRGRCSRRPRTCPQRGRHRSGCRAGASATTRARLEYGRRKKSRSQARSRRARIIDDTRMATTVQTSPRSLRQEGPGRPAGPH